MINKFILLLGSKRDFKRIGEISRETCYFIEISTSLSVIKCYHTSLHLIHPILTTPYYILYREKIKKIL